MGKKSRKKTIKSGSSGAVFTEIKQAPELSSPGISGAQVNPTSFLNGRFFELLAIAFAALVAFWFLTSRIIGVQVSVLADEYFYLLDSHYQEQSSAGFPNFLFQSLYGYTKLCGSEFYSCARNLNAFFVIFGAVFIYLIAKHLGRNKILASMVSFSAIVGSYGTYTAYYMPEAIFNGLMMVFFWALIRFGSSEKVFVWMGIGATLGFATLAKPHGLLLIPGIVVFIILWTRATNSGWVLSSLLRVGSFLVATVVTKLSIGYLLVGDEGLSLFGRYGSLQSVTSGGVRAIASSIQSDSTVNVFFTAWGQTLMVTMILGLALPVAIHGLFLAFKRDRDLFESVKFRALLGISLLNMMAAIAVFAVIIQFDVWMHTRYYSYLIPLSVIGIIEALRSRRPSLWPWTSFAVTGIFFIVSVYNFITAAMPYSSNWVDAPDFLFHIKNPQVSSFFIALSILFGLVYLLKYKAALWGALFMATLTAILSGAYTTAFLQANFVYPTFPESVATILREYLPQDELDRVQIIGNVETGQRILFSSASSTAQVLPFQEVPLRQSDLNRDTSWLVVIGDQALEGFGEPTISGLEYRMYSLDSKNSLRPRTSEIGSFSNVCPRLEDVAWSCGIESEILLREDVPARGQVDLILELGGSVFESEIEFVLGDSTIVGAFPAGTSSVSLSFSNTFPTDSLKIRLKQPSNNELPEAQKFIRPVWAQAGALNN
jgi:hypothetical protein